MMLKVTHPRSALETHAAWICLELARGTILPEVLDAGAEGGAVALGQAGGGVGEGGQAVQTLQDRGAGDRLASGDLEDQEYQDRHLDTSWLHVVANIWNNLHLVNSSNNGKI